MAVKMDIWGYGLSALQLFKSLTKFNKQQVSFQNVSLGHNRRTKILAGKNKYLPASQMTFW